MKFRYTIERKTESGVVESSSREFEKDSIRLGRGSAADVLLESRVVALTHAVLKISADGKLSVEDLGSSGGVRVNGGVVAASELKAGDVIKLGDVSLEVSRDGDHWVVTEHRTAKAQAAADSQTGSQLKKLDLTNQLPPLRYLSLALLVLLVGCFAAYPFATDDYTSWSSGPIANVHKMIEKDCKACHGPDPFVQVKDAACETCHNVGDHSPKLAKLIGSHPKLEMRCAQCHMDHNGNEGLIARDSKLCADCHGGLKARLGNESGVPDITNFATHPEFRVNVRSEQDSAKIERVSLDDKAKLVDRTAIKLNHQLHLEPNIRGEHGPTTMQCRDCHELSKDLKTIKPISFDKHCRSCHGLEFDPRLPGNQAPHGNADEVFNHVFAEYAKLHLVIEKKDDQGRLIPGQMPSQDTAQVELARATVQKESRDTETMLFTKTGCVLCHTMTEISAQEGRSRFQVVKPEIPATWLPASIFGHGAHQQIKCEECHSARESKVTTDVLLPKLATCKECHADPGHASKVGSDCTVCHSHHNPQEFDDAKRRTLREVLKR